MVTRRQGGQRRVDALSSFIGDVTPEVMRQRLSRARAMLARTLDARDASHLLVMKGVTT